MKSYRDLVVWQKSFELAREVYILTDKFPKSEIYGLTSQMRRAAISIPSNIAEGFCRGSRREFAHFVSIAFGSGAELENQFLLAESLCFMKKEHFKKSNLLTSEVMRMLNALLKSLKD